MRTTTLLSSLTLSLLLCLGLEAADLKGPIKVSPSGRHFVDQDGQPFFWLGGTAWPLFVQYPPEQAKGMRSFAGDRVVAYLSSQCTVFMHLDKITSVRARATWINPTTGERKSAGSYRTANLNGQTFPDGQAQFFTTPGHWEDASGTMR